MTTTTLPPASKPPAAMATRLPAAAGAATAATDLAATTAAPAARAAAATAGDAAPRGCTNLKLRQAARLVTRHYETHLAASGLKITQYSLLSHVVALGPVGAGALAAAMQLSASTLSRNLQPLVGAGWVRVDAGGADARSRVVEATTAGRARRAAAQRAWKRSQLALNDRLGSERVAALHVLLDGCIAAFGALEQENTDD